MAERCLWVPHGKLQLGLKARQIGVDSDSHCHVLTTGEKAHYPWLIPQGVPQLGALGNLSSDPEEIEVLPCNRLPGGFSPERAEVEPTTSTASQPVPSLCSRDTQKATDDPMLHHNLPELMWGWLGQVERRGDLAKPCAGGAFRFGLLQGWRKDHLHP